MAIAGNSENPEIAAPSQGQADELSFSSGHSGMVDSTRRPRTAETPAVASAAAAPAAQAGSAPASTTGDWRRAYQAPTPASSPATSATTTASPTRAIALVASWAATGSAVFSAIADAGQWLTRDASVAASVTPPIAKNARRSKWPRFHDRTAKTSAASATSATRTSALVRNSWFASLAIEFRAPPFLRYEHRAAHRNHLVAGDHHLVARLAASADGDGGIRVQEGPVPARGPCASRPRRVPARARRASPKASSSALRATACAASRSSAAPGRASGSRWKTSRTCPSPATVTRHSSARSATSPSNRAKRTSQAAARGTRRPAGDRRRDRLAPDEGVPRPLTGIVRRQADDRRDAPAVAGLPPRSRRRRKRSSRPPRGR